MKDYTGKTVWIIGASSGIGRALAQELDMRGAKLILSARNDESLARLNSLLGNRHAVFPLDVTKKETVAAALKQIETIDSTLYLAAAYTPSYIQDMSEENISETIAINLEGAMTCLRALIPYYKSQGHGQIALCGSVAGYGGLPGGQPYSATKAAIINLAESLRAEMRDDNIDVRLISPGFVKTPLTDKNDFAMPMMIEAEEAARAIADGLMGKKFEIHFPKTFTILMKLLSSLPYAVYFYLVSKIKR